MKKILVSACLLGDNVKYNGGNNYLTSIEKLKESYDIIPFCPEVEGGLKTPRVPAERNGHKVINKLGSDVTKEYRLGASKCLNICKALGIKKVLLKEKSPSCGKYFTYDGSFTNTLIKRMGVTSKLLHENNIEIYSEDEIDLLLESK